MDGRGNHSARGKNTDNSGSGYVFPANYKAPVYCSFRTNKLPVKLITTTQDVVANHMLKLMLASLVYNARLSSAERIELKAALLRRLNRHPNLQSQFIELHLLQSLVLLLYQIDL